MPQARLGGRDAEGKTHRLQPKGGPQRSKRVETSMGKENKKVLYKVSRSGNNVRAREAAFPQCRGNADEGGLPVPPRLAMRAAPAGHVMATMVATEYSGPQSRLVLLCRHSLPPTK